MFLGFFTDKDAIFKKTSNTIEEKKKIFISNVRCNFIIFLSQDETTG